MNTQKITQTDLNNLFKEVKELIKNDNDDDSVFLEKIKMIDKILELKN